MNAISKDMQIDETVDMYNRMYHITIKIKLADVKLGYYVDHGADYNDKDTNSKVDENCMISNQRIIFAKGNTQLSLTKTL